MISEDYSVSSESFALVQCRNCSLVFTNPRPSKDELGKYYRSENYISHTNSANSIINILYKLVRSITLQQKVKLITRFNIGPGTLLDYGCGTGHFLKQAQRKNWKVYGYEPDSTAQSIAKKQVIHGVVDTIDVIPEELDIITAWHVVEHISDLVPTINSLNEKLKKGGYLIMALPNHESYDAHYYKEHWAGYDVPRHLYHFSPLAVETFAKTFDFKLVQTLPMKLDSYYVSMLSEKYLKTGNTIRALKNGWISNQKAKRTKQYSSLIYILKK